MSDACDCSDCVDSEGPCHQDCDSEGLCQGCMELAQERDEIQFEIDSAKGRI